MILNIRGTSGSGKSYLMRRVMALYPHREPQYAEGRRQPISYLLTRPGDSGLVVPGHYSTECGGCDTIKTLDQAIAIAVTAVRAPFPGCDVLMEGLLASENVGKFDALAKVFPDVHVILLTTPVEECLAAVADRRKRRMDERPLNPSNTTNRVKTIQRACVRLRDAGIRVEELDREAAFLHTCALLRLTPPASSEDEVSGPGVRG